MAASLCCQALVALGGQLATAGKAMKPRSAIHKSQQGCTSYEKKIALRGIVLHHAPAPCQFCLHVPQLAALALYLSLTNTQRSISKALQLQGRQQCSSSSSIQTLASLASLI
jgi:hypothetical protein